MNKNSWMTDYNFVAFMAHSCGALSIMMVLAFLFGHVIMLPTAGGLLLAALVKEFWYDIRFETPTQTVTDGLIDFAGYATGTLIGSIIILIAQDLLGK